MLVLVTGATGKVGQAFLSALLSAERWAGARVRALCHNRTVAPHPRIDIVRGTVADRNVVARALDGVTHVIHMATVKEDPATAMDVSVKGMFWLLEEFRQSPTAEQFILIGGDCSVGHIVVPYDKPITEDSPRRAYPGVYALSKVLEEVMLEQSIIQYGIKGTILRAPWIMDKDDFRYVLSFGDDQFGGPAWDTLISEADRARYHSQNGVPLLIDAAGRPLQRSFVHVSDLVAAMLAALGNPAAFGELFNVGMNRPVDYAEVTAHLAASRGMVPVRIETPFHSNWLDSSKARMRLAWEPEYDTTKLIEEAFAYQRADDDVRRIWYVG